MLEITVDASRALDKVNRLPEVLRKYLRGAITDLTQALANRVRQKLSGEVLNVRSGALLASIHSETVENATEIYGRVYSIGVPYAAIHEYGGVTKPHDIYPVNAKALAFMLGGEMRFFKSVHHPGSRIPERSYMRSSLAEMQDLIVATLTQAKQDAAQELVS